jgi:hypothetical protein
MFEEAAGVISRAGPVLAQAGYVDAVRVVAVGDHERDLVADPAAQVEDLSALLLLDKRLQVGSVELVLGGDLCGGILVTVDVDLAFGAVDDQLQVARGVGGEVLPALRAAQGSGTGWQLGPAAGTREGYRHGRPSRGSDRPVIGGAASYAGR